MFPQNVLEVLIRTKARLLARTVQRSFTLKRVLSTAHLSLLASKSIATMMALKFVLIRLTVSGVKRLAQPAQMVSCAPSIAIMDSNGPILAPEEAGVKLVFRPSAQLASLVPWNVPRLRPLVVLNAQQASIAKKELQTSSWFHVQREDTVRTESLSLLVLQEPSMMTSTERVSPIV